MSETNYILSCCSTADLTKEHFQSRGISYIPFHFALGGTWYPDDLGESVPFPEFYRRMEEGEDTTTSQVNPEEYVAYFEAFLKEGKDILHVTLSSGISGTLNSAKIAAEELQERYPDRKLYLVDSLGASSGYGLLMDRLADLRDEGMGIDEVRDFAVAHRLEVHHWFFSTDLKYYVKGGRISKTSGFIGNTLQIRPLLNMDEKGLLVPRDKYRGTGRVIKEIADRMERCAKDGTAYSGKCYISQSACQSVAEKTAAEVEARFPHLNGKVEINSIGTTIGSHTGPGTVALFFWGEPRG